VLEKDYEIVGTLNGGAAVLHEWTRLKPDLVVLDISMGDLNGIEVARRLRKSGCDSRIIFLTIHQDPEFVRAALDAGASGYVLKSRMRAELTLAINSVLSDKSFVSPGIGERYRTI